MAASSAKPRSRRFRKAARIFFALLLLAVLSLLIPAVFQLALRQFLVFEAWRHGGSVQVARVQGSLFQPVILLDSRWSFHSRTGSLIRLEAARAEAEFAWRELLPASSGHWFRRLTLQGVAGKIQLTVARTAPRLKPERTEEPPPEETGYSWPTRVEANDVDLLFQSEGDSLRLQGSRVLLTELEPGFLEVSRLTVKQPWLARTFHNVHGTTAVQDGRITVADLQLDPSVQVKNFSADLREIARGHLDMEMQVAAFGGNMRAQAQTIPNERGTELQATGNFSQIAIGPLATFLGLSEAAGGTIKEGKFTFRGLPSDLAKASLTLRLEATNFQWESRQWDSLVLGATLMEGRMQIPELELQQGHNHLSLNGEMPLPNGPVPWWQSDFRFTIGARVENLTELSALLLPEFRYAAGKVSIDGDVRGKDQQLSGTLIVSGSDLTWQNAPIQELRAAIRLAGKELQVASLDLLNKDDFVRGQGVFSLDGSSAYRGELRASVEDLATYSALLQKPLVPQPLAGGAIVRWMGEGSAKGQSGRFFARLQKLRPLGLNAPQLHPVNVEVEGSYLPERLQFSRFEVADEECSLHAAVEIAARTLKLQGLRLTHGAETWLEGEALLPLDVGRAWTDARLSSLLAEGVPGQLRLKATGLSLERAARLSGWAWPAAGTLEGEVTAAGALGHLDGSGHLSLRDGRLPLTGGAPELQEVRGDFTLKGQTLTGTALSARHASGAYTAEGSLDLEHFRNPELRAQIGGKRVQVPLFPSLTWPAFTATGTVATGRLLAEMDMSLRLQGPADAATLSGEAWLASLQAGGQPDISMLWKGVALPELPLAFAFTEAPFAKWKLAIRCARPATAPLEPGLGTVLPALQITGTAASPLLAGTVRFARIPALGGQLTLTIDEAALSFREASPRDPSLDLHATGMLGSLPFNAYAVGPLSRHIALVDSETAHAALLKDPASRKPEGAAAPESAGAPEGERPGLGLPTPPPTVVEKAKPATAEVAP